MTKERLANVAVTEAERTEFESQLLGVVEAAYQGDEQALEIMLKMKQAIGSF
ncbi:hypothetical protein [Bacillus sp. AFS075034]|uniref:hypothetical protein n=1 Tax=Bacillus sp. AFS075034 TaxID=2034281 RepID=UPI00159BA9F1|nr:hypothetical protein [Bacillus sp. AFS075034]